MYPWQYWYSRKEQDAPKAKKLDSHRGNTHKPWLVWKIYSVFCDWLYDLESPVKWTSLWLTQECRWEHRHEITQHISHSFDFKLFILWFMFSSRTSWFLAKRDAIRMLWFLVFQWFIVSSRFTVHLFIHLVIISF